MERRGGGRDETLHAIARTHAVRSVTHWSQNANVYTKNGSRHAAQRVEPRWSAAYGTSGRRIRIEECILRADVPSHLLHGSFTFTHASWLILSVTTTQQHCALYARGPRRVAREASAQAYPTAVTTRPPPAAPRAECHLSAPYPVVRGRSSPFAPLSC
jgi:hypothetical protein